MQKKSSLKAIGELRCPRCRNGKLFSTPLYNLNTFYLMNKKCEHCSLYFEIEPGFYYGAMYLTYAFSVAMMTAVAIFYYLIFNEIRVWYVVGTIAVIMLILMPLLFRYSRVLFLYWFGGVPYDEMYSK